MPSNPISTRRHFLHGAAIGMAAIATRPLMAQGANPARLAPDTGRKFSADGKVLPFAGNTIICHLPQQGPQSRAFDALLDIYRAMPGRDWMRKVTPLPPSSYHMTIFGGANDKERRYPLWPAGMPLDTPMEQCDEMLGERLRKFRLAADGGPYHMRVNTDVSPKETPLTIRLLPAEEGTDLKLRRLRDRLSQVTGIREPGHDHYGFHITLGYLFSPLNEAENAAFHADLSEWKGQLAQKAPVITLGAPEYCLLKDMFAFNRQFYLR